MNQLRFQMRFTAARSSIDDYVPVGPSTEGRPCFGSCFEFDLWQEKSSANRQSGRCVHVEHIGAVLPAHCPPATAGPAKNRQRATVTACFIRHCILPSPDFIPVEAQNSACTRKPQTSTGPRTASYVGLTTC